MDNGTGNRYTRVVNIDALDRFVIEFIVNFCEEHQGNGPVVREIITAVKEAGLEGGSHWSINQSLERLEEEYRLIEVDKSGNHRIPGRIRLIGARWRYPAAMKQCWPGEGAPEPK